VAFLLTRNPNKPQRPVGGRLAAECFGHLKKEG